MKKVAFLFSGRGSLLSTVREAIADSEVEAMLGPVITNNAGFTPEGNAVFDGVSLFKVDHRDFNQRIDFDSAISKILLEHETDLIILGGFKRIFSPGFVKDFGAKTMNTHPSLLPSFPGDKAQLKALQGGLRITGATLHFINEDVDEGPIIDQEPVRILNGMTEDELKEKIILAERKMIYRAVRAYLDNRLSIRNDRVVYEGYADV